MSDHRPDEIYVSYDFGKLLDKLGKLTTDIATMTVEIAWIKRTTETLCEDMEEMKQFRWKMYGIATGLSIAVNVIMYLLNIR